MGERFQAVGVWGRWVLMSALGALLAEVVITTVVSVTSWSRWDVITWWLLHATLYGLIASAVQRCGLPPDLRGRGQWLVAGVLGGVLSWPPSWDLPRWDSPWVEESLLTLMTYGLLGGAAIGLCSWPFLRRYPSNVIGSTAAAGSGGMGM